MPETTVIVNHKVGLHARPASLFEQAAAKLLSDISVSHGERTANGKSILTVLTLSAHKGAEITIVAEGDDAEEALAALEESVKNNFGEE
jgi:phosphocarrier protein